MDGTEGLQGAAEVAQISRLGACPLPDGRCAFRVWAPHARRVDVKLVDSGRIEALQPSADGHFAAALSQGEVGTAYV